MSKQKNRKWYQRTHQFTPYTRAEGEAVASEFDAIQAAFEKIPTMRDDGAGFEDNFVIPEPTEDNHPVPFGMLKDAEKGVLTNKDIVVEKAEEVSRNTESVAQNTRLSTENKNASEAASQAAEISATNASQSENMARKWAVNPLSQAVTEGLFSSYHYAMQARDYANAANNAQNSSNSAKDTAIQKAEIATQKAEEAARSAELARRLSQGDIDWSHVLNPPNASTTQKGLIQIANDLTTDDATKALSAAQGKILRDRISIIEVGGRNYLRNSSFSENLNHWRNWGDCSRTFEVVNSKTFLRIKSDNSTRYKGVITSAALKPNTYYVISVIAFSPNASTLSFGFHQEPNRTQIWSSGVVLENTPKRHFFTFKSDYDPNKNTFTVMIGMAHASPCDIYIADAKLEIGTIATDWTAAPEDLIENANLNYVAKAGDTMTGPLNINHATSYLKGKNNGVDDWIVGRARNSDNDIVLSSYKHNTTIRLKSDRVELNKPLHVRNDSVVTLSELNKLKVLALAGL